MAAKNKETKPNKTLYIVKRPFNKQRRNAMGYRVNEKVKGIIIENKDDAIYIAKRLRWECERYTGNAEPAKRRPVIEKKYISVKALLRVELQELVEKYMTDEERDSGDTISINHSDEIMKKFIVSHDSVYVL